MEFLGSKNSPHRPAIAQTLKVYERTTSEWFGLFSINVRSWNRLRWQRLGTALPYTCMHSLCYRHLPVAILGMEIFLFESEVRTVRTYWFPFSHSDDHWPCYFASCQRICTRFFGMAFREGWCGLRIQLRLRVMTSNFLWAYRHWLLGGDWNHGILSDFPLGMSSSQMGWNHQPVGHTHWKMVDWQSNVGDTLFLGNPPIYEHINVVVKYKQGMRQNLQITYMRIRRTYVAGRIVHFRCNEIISMRYMFWDYALANPTW